jgi:hypothetical protein
VLEAPRKDAPIPNVVAEEALRILPTVLSQTPWAGIEVSNNAIVECSALYTIQSRLEGPKPSRKEMRQRLNAFTPLFLEERSSAVQAALLLRFKAVSNFVVEADPIKRFITSLYLNSSSLAVVDLEPDKLEERVVQEFGVTEAVAKENVQEFLRSTLEYVRADPEKDARAVAARNWGVRVRIEPLHPMYLVEIGGAGSFLDLQRILSLVTVLASRTSRDLALSVPSGPVAEVVAVANNAAAEAEEEQVEWTEEELAMIQGMPAEEEAEAEEAVEGAVAVAEAAEAEAVEGNALELLPPIGDEWYLRQMTAKDRQLFDPLPKPVPAPKSYSLTCQKNAGRQPFVLDEKGYRHARTAYGETVFWLEAPLTPYDELAITLANKTVGMRKTYGVSEAKKTMPEILELEKRALELGVELKPSTNKAGQVVRSLSETERGVSAEDKADLQRRMEEQGKKYLMSVIRLGTNMDKPNYYICGELWCVHDDLPLVPAEYEGRIDRPGQKKRAGAVGCPFCGGVEFKDEKHPVLGETVLRRGKKATGKAGEADDEVTRFVG